MNRTGPTNLSPLHLGPDLIASIRRGDQSAFAALVRTYQSFAYALAFRLMLEHNEAEEVVQESFVRVWNHIGTYEPEQRFTTWLYTIVTRLCLDRLRWRKRWRSRFVSSETTDVTSLPAPHLAPDEELSVRDMVAHIRTLVKGLPRKQQLVFTLRDLQDLSVEAVATITGMSPGAVKTNLCHARQAIRKRLANTETLVGR